MIFPDQSKNKIVTFTTASNLPYSRPRLPIYYLKHKIMVVPYEPRRVLRSAESNLLTVPPGKPGKYGSRSFVRASANLWNSLRGERAAWLKNSPTVESFKINLKTYLFCERLLS